MQKIKKMRLPNLLLISTDSLRFDFLGCAGGPARTPNIDALAAEGLRFETCITNSPVCAPTRCALATGIEPHRLGGQDNDVQLQPNTRTYYGQLRDHGYHVACAGKLDLGKPSGLPGPDGAAPRAYAWGFTQPHETEGDSSLGRLPHPTGPYSHYLAERGNFETLHQDIKRRNASGVVLDIADFPLETEDFVDSYIGRQALEWLRNPPQHNPWHLFVSFIGPHFPYSPPTEYADRWRDAEMPERVVSMEGKPHRVLEKFDDHDPDYVVNSRRQYCGRLELIDDQIGKLVAQLKANGDWENTWIFFTSDHGDNLGDHGLMTAGNPYEPSVNVPLIASGPGCRDGGVSKALVEWFDLGPTCCELAGVPVIPEVQARSFAPVLRGESDAHREDCLSHFRGFQVLRTATHKFIHNEDQTPELYDMVNDPGETRNLLHGDDVSDDTRALAQKLQKRIGERWVGAHTWSATEPSNPS